MIKMETRIRELESDASFHLNHGFTSSFKCIDLSFISTGPSILALGFKKFFYPSQDSLPHPVHNGAHLQVLQHPPLLWQPYLLRVWLHWSSHPNQLQAG